eukprot:TRINITY_DN29944_c0_g1_i1.p1 TRINITY_DN29944_c0_g1~~TRINITY_DN29944_c0_g1_i1.p1  ORF type:complete len:329 (+),score=63.70 TRINITY_DN29944_c0_g1_i1:68-988(+)
MDIFTNGNAPTAPKRLSHSSKKAILSVINSCKRVGRGDLIFDVARKATEALTDKASVEAAEICSASISACTKTKQWERALELFYDFRARSMYLDTVCWETAMLACSNWEQAINLFSMMRSCPTGDVEVGTDAYQTAMHACSRLVAWEHCCSLLAESKLSGIRADVTSYNIAMSAFGKGQQWNRALQLLDGDLISEERLEPDLVTFNSLMTGLTNGKFWRGALVMLAQLERNRLEPNHVTLSAAASACETGGQVEDSPALLGKADWLHYMSGVQAKQSGIIAQRGNKEAKDRRFQLQPLPSDTSHKI